MWQADRGGFRGKEEVANKSFLNAPAVEAIREEASYIRIRADAESARVRARHAAHVHRKARELRMKARLPPQVVVPKFGKWKPPGQVEVVLQSDVDDLDLGEMRFDHEGEEGLGEGEEEEEEPGIRKVGDNYFF